MSEPTLTVGQFIEIVNGVLRQSFGDGLWVQGEIEGFNGRGKHVYFNLVERTSDSKAALSISIWQGNMARLRPLMAQHRLELADGIKVRIFGTPDIYPQRGSFGFKVSNIDPRFTLGDLAGQRDEVIRVLKEQGLYDANRNLPVPLVPLRVGLITSVGSAAHADALHEFENSGFGFQVSVYDVRVQGDEAVPTVITALSKLGQRDDLDVIMIVRGGGSRTDLLAFDTHEIAAAIAHCRLPVFTGIGHEIDISVADEVASKSFKTPTACAAAIGELVHKYVDSIEENWRGIAISSTTQLHNAERRLNERAGQVKNRIVDALQRASTSLSIANDRIRRRPFDVLVSASRYIDAASDRLRVLDPVNTMARGWSVTRTTGGQTVRSSTQILTGDKLVTSFADGSATSTVNSVSVVMGAPPRNRVRQKAKKAGI
ncbi:MAG: exodeoxyribonuclease VII large subunit [Ilumatobacteraceae bacterium]